MNISFAFVLAIFISSVVADLPTERIVNGNAAAPYQFPWHVSIQGVLTNNQSTLCGGALVGPAHVLTAAHCVAGANYQIFNLGFGSNSLSYPLVSMRSDVLQRVIHPNYNNATYANDLALLRLPLNITYNLPAISVIRLPSRAQENLNFVNVSGILTGFGRTTDQSSISEQLRYARTRVIDRNQCVAYYGSAVVTVDVLCTLGQDFNAQGPCANDNGGPLSINEPSGNTLIGIQSFISGSGCNAGHPAGYVRLGAYITWISQQAGIPIRY